MTAAVTRRGNQLVISAELIDGATGERLWGQTFDPPIADLMSVQDSIVSSIAEGLRLRLTGEEKARLGGYGTGNAEAYEFYLKGRFLMQSETEEGDLEARALFLQAVEKDPGFLDAHLAIAITLARAGNGYPPPREAAAHARGLSRRRQPSIPTTRRARCLDPATIQASRDWVAAEREYRTLMNDPAVLRTIRYHPIALFFVAIGRPDEAVALMERALVVDPGNLGARVMLGNFLLQAGRLDEALRATRASRPKCRTTRGRISASPTSTSGAGILRPSEARRKAHELSCEDH